MGRFDYVKYDQAANEKQALLKMKTESLEGMIDEQLPDSTAKSLALTNLEVAYMWLGKAIRDEQILRNGSAPLQEERRDEP